VSETRTALVPGVAPPVERIEACGMVFEADAEGRARLTLPRRRPEADEAVARLLLVLAAANPWGGVAEPGADQVTDKLRRELSEAHRRIEALERKAAPPAPAPVLHGVFDVSERNRREVWSQGALERAIPRSRIERASRRPWGSYPDIAK
jgi:hypothetical protein